MQSALGCVALLQALAAPAVTLLACCLLQAVALASRKRKQRETEERRNEQRIRDQLARVVMLPLQTCKRPRMTATVRLEGLPASGQAMVQHAAKLKCRQALSNLGSVPISSVRHCSK